MRWSRYSLCLGVALAAAAACPPAARADECGTAPDFFWNVPKGAAVFAVQGGPVQAVLNGVGESRTHTMLSHGPWTASQTSMHAPDPRSVGDSNFCNAPVDPNQLQLGYPGAEYISVPAAYVFLAGAATRTYQNGQIFGAGTSVQTNLGAQIADGAYNNVGRAIVNTPSGGMWQYRPWSPSYLGNSPYSLFQYRNIEGVEYGGIAPEHGMVCSTFLAYLQSLQAKGGGFGSPGYNSPHTYSHAQTGAAGYALYDSVKNDCEAGMGFWKHMGTLFRCFDSDLCDEAAAQVRNCMAFDDCSNGDPSEFDNAAQNDPNFTSTSISPDWLGGWVSGQNWSGPGNSVWAWDVGHPVQWNGPGSVYSCWY